MCLNIETVKTIPYQDQKPGTSGLRKKVLVFQKENYTENFVQCILDANKEAIVGSSLVVGGDGRYYLEEAVAIIAKIAAANKVAKLIIGKNGILSTPAASHIIRKYKLLGGILLTASHNPGGPTEDFGIKFNCSNGGPAPDAVTEEIYNLSKNLETYKIVKDLNISLNKIGKQNFDIQGRQFEVEIIDSVQDYLELMQEIFDFDKLKLLIKGSNQREPFKVLLDSMHGVTGQYIERIFKETLGAEDKNIRRTNTLPDFGGFHPDPNLTYAKELVKKLEEDCTYDFGAAFDGDGDRNMLLGKKSFFVTPSDSLAIIGNNLECIPYFKKNGVFGFARSMPTAAAIDRVAQKLGKESFETPTGWKYFGNLMDANRISLCGEESFGTGSNHIREKDGIWAALAWLSIIEHTKKSVQEICEDHWKQYGRNYFTRYDYENCAEAPCKDMMNYLQELADKKQLIGKQYSSKGKSYVVKEMDNFQYTDPIDKSVASKQGIRIIFECGSRIIVRLSGTGSSGATVRLYGEYYADKEVLGSAQDMLKPIVDIALEITKLKEYTGRDAPTVIT